MATSEKTTITVAATVNAPIEKVWEYWTAPQHITQWNNASNDWHTPKATNDLRKDGTFHYRMEAKDGSFGFDFAGTYTAVEPCRLLEYSFGERSATVQFLQQDAGGAGSALVVAGTDPEPGSELLGLGEVALAGLRHRFALERNHPLIAPAVVGEVEGHREVAATEQCIKGGVGTEPGQPFTVECIGIGGRITQVQKVFKAIFNLEARVELDTGTQQPTLMNDNPGTYLLRGMNGLKRSVPQAEGLAMDEQGTLYLVSEPNLFYRFGRETD